MDLLSDVSRFGRTIPFLRAWSSVGELTVGCEATAGC